MFQRKRVNILEMFLIRSQIGTNYMTSYETYNAFRSNWNSLCWRKTYSNIHVVYELTYYFRYCNFLTDAFTDDSKNII